MSRVRFRAEILILACAAFLRLAGALAAAFRLNPYADDDALKFAEHARGIAAGNHNTGDLLHLSSDLFGGITDVWNIWSTLLSPAYLVPGIGGMVARLVLVALSVVAVWNVLVLGRALHSRPAGLIAATPVAIYPSIVLVESSLLREGLVLFLLTSLARLAFAPPTRLRTSWPLRAGLGLFASVFVVALRWELLYLIVATAVVTAAVRVGRLDLLREHRLGTTVTGIAVVGVGWMVAGFAAEYLSSLRPKRANGRTAYLGEVDISSQLSMLAFLPIGAAYFLFAPFPWMVESVADLVAAVEGLGNLLFSVAAVFGAVALFRTWQRRRRAFASYRTQIGWVGLGTFAVLGVSLFALGTANAGTAVRHRQMFLWVLFLFGAVGMVEVARESGADRRVRRRLRRFRRARRE